LRGSDSADPGGARISQRREADTLVVEVAGEIDLSNADLLARGIRRAEETDAHKIVLDLNDLEFIDSTGLRELLIAQRRNDEDSDRLRLRNINGAVARVVKITGLSDVLKRDHA
jgi:anti-sigma B factor antagonist